MKRILFSIVLVALLSVVGCTKSESKGNDGGTNDNPDADKQTDTDQPPTLE